MIRGVYPRSWIPDPDFFLSGRIPDPEVKKSLDLGFGSARPADDILYLNLSYVGLLKIFIRISSAVRNCPGKEGQNE
jgi:hypothetical protein